MRPRWWIARPVRLGIASLVAVLVAAGCSSDGEPSARPDSEEPSDAPVASAPDVAPPQFVLDVRDAIDAVESELGGPQRFFEVTANPQLTNVFVAVDDATAAVPYAYIDGELQPPAPRQEGASGQTFVAADVDFADERVLSGVSADLPESTIDAISVYGDGVGATYVLRARSSVGGQLDIVVGANGAVFSVDPL